MPEAMPGALAIHPTPRRIPPRSERLAWAWYSTWGLLCRLLLGFYGATFCWRRNEPALDSRPDYIRPPGKSNSDGPHDCAGRRRCVGREWGMAAGNGANQVDFLIAAVRAANVSYGRVEDGRGSLGPMANAPFPTPAHQTGRADFRHPAFRPASPQGTRRDRSGQALEAQNAEFSMNYIECESAIAAPLHLVPSGSPEAVARPRLPQNVACGFPAPRSSAVGSQLSLLSVQVSFPWSADLLSE